MSLRVAAFLCCASALATAQNRPPTPEDARKFIDDAEQKILALGIDAGRADWIRSTYIIDDAEILAAKMNEKAIAATVAFAKEATRFDGLQLDPVTARKINAHSNRADGAPLR